MGIHRTHTQPAADEDRVADFWGANPCGEGAVDAAEGDLDDFFRRYDRYRYAKEPHILRRLDSIDWRGKRVLEVGLGLGADSEQLIRRGAHWSGVDLTRESVERVAERLAIRNLAYDALEVATARSLPFEDSRFDLVYSFGVLHHIPDIDAAQRELARVLKPGGRLIAMLYARRSLNYLVSIAVVRRLALTLLYPTPLAPSGIVGTHLRLAREQGLAQYLRLSSFVHRSTDGPLNPYSKVYDAAAVRRDFPCFRLVDQRQEFMYAPPLPVGRLPLERWLGWHLWVTLEPMGGSPSLS